MADVTITVRDNGPLMVQGSINLVDGDGKPLETKDATFLCRCGQSHKKPFCDGTHGKENFTSCVRAEQVLNRT